MFRAFRHNTPAVVGFLLICIFGIVARVLNGTVYSEAEILDLYGALRQSGLYLGSAIATSAATTLALMLTMLGLVRRMDKNFDREVYQTVALIALCSAICLVASVVLLLTITLPMGQFDGVPDPWYRILYNSVFATIVFICALSVAVILLLLSTVLTVIREITPGDEA